MKKVNNWINNHKILRLEDSNFKFPIKGMLIKKNTVYQLDEIMWLEEKLIKSNLYWFIRNPTCNLKSPIGVIINN
jgi:hypothetical protein